MTPMYITLDTLKQFLNKASYKANGDSYEQEFGELLTEHFPNCEKFWIRFVIPMTERMMGYPTTLPNNIRFRQAMSVDLEDISMAHYSMFLNLVYAHIHLQNPSISQIEDFYVHLASACDLVETLFERVYMLLLSCRDGKTKTLQALTREEFLLMAGKWYDNEYPIVYDYYLSKGKFAQMELPSRELLVKEFVKDYLGQNKLWKDFYRLSKSIREFRNVIVHDVQVGKFMINGAIFIPKPKVIQSYRTWRQVFSVSDPDIFRRDFAPVSQQLKEDLDLLESILNQLWEIVMHELELELYEEDKTKLRGLYELQI